MSKMDITFFIPCLNEEKNIEATWHALFAATRPFPFQWEILAVDDGSTDNTLKILQKIRQDHPTIPIHIVRNEKTRGLGRNYLEGASKATGEYYMIINGDNAEPAEAIQAILAEKGKADMIIPYFGKMDQRSRTRRLLSWIFVRTVNLLSGNSIHYYNGPVLHRTENVRSCGLKTTGFSYQAELICKLVGEKKTFQKVRVPNINRRWGLSKAFGPANILSVLGSLALIFWRRVRKKS